MAVGRFVAVRPFKACDFSAYHGTYSARAAGIRQEGLRPAAPRGAIWLSASPKFAAAHAAYRAALDGCAGAPITVLKIRVKGEAGACPVFRPLKKPGVPGLFVTPIRIPPERILSGVPADPRALAAGHARARARLRKMRRPRPVSCPPPVMLLGVTDESPPPPPRRRPAQLQAGFSIGEFWLGALASTMGSFLFAVVEAINRRMEEKEKEKAK
jgi:hypothetical protein